MREGQGRKKTIVKACSETVTIVGVWGSSRGDAGAFIHLCTL